LMDLVLVRHEFVGFQMSMTKQPPCFKGIEINRDNP